MVVYLMKFCERNNIDLKIDSNPSIEKIDKIKERLKVMDERNKRISNLVKLFRNNGSLV